MLNWITRTIETIGSAIAVLAGLFVWLRSKPNRSGPAKPVRTIAMDLTLLTKAYDNGRKALDSFNAGKRFTAISQTGKAIDYAGQFGAGVTNEGATEADDGGAVVMMSAGPDQEAMTCEEAFDAVEEKIAEAKTPTVQGAGPGETKAIGPIAMMLIQIAISKLLKKLFPNTPSPN